MPSPSESGEFFAGGDAGAGSGGGGVGGVGGVGDGGGKSGARDGGASASGSGSGSGGKTGSAETLPVGALGFGVIPYPPIDVGSLRYSAPCTAIGCMELLDRYGVDLAGKVSFRVYTCVCMCLYICKFVCSRL